MIKEIAELIGGSKPNNSTKRKTDKKYTSVLTKPTILYLTNLKSNSFRRSIIEPR